MINSSNLERVNNCLDQVLETQSVHPRLQEAMRYATLNGGKRLRPQLIYTTSALYGVDVQKVDPIAAAYEMVQAYSLVHDDLPDMDNSPLRRGQPSCWKAYDPATAILVGDGLLTLAFDVIAKSAQLSERIRLELIQNLATAAGPNGMVAGQMFDIYQNLPADLKHVQQTQLLKTGVFFAACCEVGAILGEVKQDRPVLRQFGHNLGLLFQITDDLLDVEGTSEVIGKPTASDTGKQTFVSHLGLDGAKDFIVTLSKETKSLASTLTVPAPALVDVIDSIATRNS